MQISALFNRQIVSNLKSLVADGNRLVAKVVAYLIEAEDRRLHLAASCTSMFVYCTQTLGFSEGAAFRRLAAARLVRRFPALVDAGVPSNAPEVLVSNGC
jgi:hypothetical protein